MVAPGVVGFSRMTGRDQEGRLFRPRSLRAEFRHPKQLRPVELATVASV